MDQEELNKVFQVLIDSNDAGEDPEPDKKKVKEESPKAKLQTSASESLA